MIAAVVPVKSFSEGKSRLSPHLSASERLDLMTQLAASSVRALRASSEISEVALATSERSLARALGAHWLRDQGSLNSTLVASSDWAIECGADALLIIPADLPYIRPDDIDAVAQAWDGRRGVVVAPTHDRGTGALLIGPPDAIPPAFGELSAERHARLALAAGLNVREIVRRGFWHDLDTLDDLVHWRQEMQKGHTDGMASADVSREATP